MDASRSVGYRTGYLAAREDTMRAGWTMILLGTLMIGGAAVLSWTAPQPAAPETRAERRAKRKAIKQSARTSGEGANARGGRPSNVPRDPSPQEAAVVAPTPLTEATPAARQVNAPAAPPHVVFIMGCTVRKDQLTPYGGPATTTPHLSSLAAEGTVVDDLVAAAPWTRAASTAILTGHHPVTLGMVEPGPRRNDRKLPEATRTLAERFVEQGYITIGGTANPNLLPEFGFDQGFDHYQPGLKANWAKKLDGKKLVDALVQKVDDLGTEKPLYLQMMFLEAHAPRTAPKSDYGTFAEHDMPDRIAQYRFHVHELDSVVGYLETALASRGLDRTNTLFVFVADHGEGMNYPRHHGYAHGQYPMPSVVHVPWIMAGPGVAQGHRVLGVASQVDITATIAGVLGWPQVDDTEGRDLSPAVRGAPTTDQARVWVDTWFQEANRAAVFTPTHQCQKDFGSSARQKKKGLFIDGCFDRHADPLLAQPLEQDLPLLEDLTAWRAKKAEALTTTQAEKTEVDQDLADQLEALGYRE